MTRVACVLDSVSARSSFAGVAKAFVPASAELIGVKQQRVAGLLEYVQQSV